jgi:hypothetical protein
VVVAEAVLRASRAVFLTALISGMAMPAANSATAILLK